MLQVLHYHPPDPPAQGGRVVHTQTHALTHVLMDDVVLLSWSDYSRANGVFSPSSGNFFAPSELGRSAPSLCLSVSGKMKWGERKCAKLVHSATSPRLISSLGYFLFPVISSFFSNSTLKRFWAPNTPEALDRNCLLDECEVLFSCQHTDPGAARHCWRWTHQDLQCVTWPAMRCPLTSCVCQTFRTRIVMTIVFVIQCAFEHFFVFISQFGL